MPFRDREDLEVQPLFVRALSLAYPPMTLAEARKAMDEVLPGAQRVEVGDGVVALFVERERAHANATTMRFPAFQAGMLMATRKAGVEGHRGVWAVAHPDGGALVLTPPEFRAFRDLLEEARTSKP